MPLRIVSWNTRGNPTNNQNKLRTLRYLMASNDIILIQEAGTLYNTRHLIPMPAGSGIYHATHAGARNPRCNTVIITTRGHLRNFRLIYLPSGTGRSCLVGEYSYQGNYILIGTMHAAAFGAGAFDSNTLVSRLLAQTLYPFVIGGDFNADPERFRSNRTRTRVTGSSSRPGPSFYSSSAGPTHTSGNTLDHFVFSYGLTSRNTRRYHSLRDSDHRPILTEIDFRVTVSDTRIVLRPGGPTRKRKRGNDRYSPY